MDILTASSEFSTYRLCEQLRFRRACAFAQSRQNLRCSLIQAVNQEEPSDRKSDPWPLWMAGHAQLKFVRPIKKRMQHWISAQNDKYLSCFKQNMLENEAKCNNGTFELKIYHSICVLKQKCHFFYFLKDTDSLWKVTDSFWAYTLCYML